MSLLFKDRVLETSSTTGTGTYTLAGAVTGYQAFSAVGDGSTCMYSAWEVDGNGNPSGGWEVGYGTYTLSGTTLARTAIIASTNSNNAVSWAAGTRRIACVLPALQGNVAPQSLAGGRLTLATGYSVYAPQPATPSSTDTGTEIVTFAAAHGWVTGTMCTVSATAGGLTAGTTYFLNALSTTTAAFYTTLADAEANTSKVNLTASITAQVIPFGVQSTTIKYVPHVHDMLGIPSADGLTWGQYTIGSAGLSLALGTLTSGSIYDVFAYISGGVATLKLGPAWSSSTSRGTGAGTTEVVLINGVWVNAVSITSGPAANAGRLLGSIKMVSTTATEESTGNAYVGGKRFVSDISNPIDKPLFVGDSASTWTLAVSTAWSQRGTKQVEAVFSLPSKISLVNNVAGAGAASSYCNIAIGRDSTSVAVVVSTCGFGGPGILYMCVATLDSTEALGYHYYAWLENSGGLNTCTFYSIFASPTRMLAGMSGIVEG